MLKNIVDNFLFLVEKQWPLNDYIWSQESALEFLSINDYDIDKTVKTINEITDTFKQFLDCMIFIKLFISNSKKIKQTVSSHEC